MGMVINYNEARNAILQKRKDNVPMINQLETVKELLDFQAAILENLVNATIDAILSSGLDAKLFFLDRKCVKNFWKAGVEDVLKGEKDVELSSTALIDGERYRTYANISYVEDKFFIFSLVFKKHENTWLVYEEGCWVTGMEDILNFEE